MQADPVRRHELSRLAADPDRPRGARCCGQAAHRRDRGLPDRGPAFTDQQIDLLETFADQAVIAIENVRLFKELQARNPDLTEALEQQTATGEILKVICELAHRRAARVRRDRRERRAALRGAFDGVSSASRARRSISCATTGSSPRGGALAASCPMAPSAGPPPAGPSWTAASWNPGRPADPEYRAARAPRTGLAQRARGADDPRRGRDRRDHRDPRRRSAPFTDAQIELLKTFADQAVIAIENVRLFPELEARNRDLTEALDQQTATGEVLRVISRLAADSSRCSRRIAENAARLCGASGRSSAASTATVASWRPMTVRPERRAFGEQHPDRPGPRQRHRARGAGAAAVHIHDVAGRAASRRFRSAQLRAAPDLLAVPMLRESERSGRSSSAGTEVRPFTDSRSRCWRPSPTRP